MRRLAAVTPFAVAPSDNDYPALAAGRDGNVWAAFVAYTHGNDPDMEAAAKHDFRSLVTTRQRRPDPPGPASMASSGRPRWR